MVSLHGVISSSRVALILRALKTAVLLSLLFVVVYGSINWLTDQRPDAHVHAWYFAWELSAIPFVPLLIVPYMSLDLFFFGAPFLCRGERELRAFSKRVVFSTLAAAAFFLLLPLKLAWPDRPKVGGWFGDLVERSCTAPFLMEYPHNLFPAMHIALCMIVGAVYGRHLRGIGRVLSHTWFTLIALSTVLTWQHHLVDVAGGFLLGAFAFYLFPESRGRLPVVPNLQVGRYYAAGGAAVLLLAPPLWPWGAFLLWPAASLGVVAAAYFGAGPASSTRPAAACQRAHVSCLRPSWSGSICRWPTIAVSAVRGTSCARCVDRSRPDGRRVGGGHRRGCDCRAGPHGRILRAGAVPSDELPQPADT